MAGNAAPPPDPDRYSKFPFAGNYEDAYEVFSRDNWKKKENPAAAALKDWLKDLWTVFGLVVRAAACSMHTESKDRSYEVLLVTTTYCDVQNALLVSTSITPFLATPTFPTCEGYAPFAADADTRKAIYGILWTLTIGLNCVSLLTTVLCLGYLLAIPPTEKDMKKYWTRTGRYFASAPAFATVVGAVCLIVALTHTAIALHCWPGAAAAVVSVAFAGVVVTVTQCARTSAENKRKQAIAASAAASATSAGTSAGTGAGTSAGNLDVSGSAPSKHSCSSSAGGSTPPSSDQQPPVPPINSDVVLSMVSRPPTMDSARSGVEGGQLGGPQQRTATQSPH